MAYMMSVGQKKNEQFISMLNAQCSSSECFNALNHWIIDNSLEIGNWKLEIAPSGVLK